MQTYRTAEVATIIGIHPNTVRLYEKLGLIPPPERQANGYRIFTDFHLAQFRLARTAFQIELLQNGLRKTIIEIVKTSAKGKFDRAITLTDEYLSQVQSEQQRAEDAIFATRQLLSDQGSETGRKFKRKEVSEYLSVSMDALRNWEMNGLLTVKRKENGYRVYTEADVLRLTMIRSLRCANYSLEAILRMLNALSINPSTDIEEVLNTPKPDEEIIAVCDQLLGSLNAAETNAQMIRKMLNTMKRNFLNSPL
ncbi:MAG: MerR family transcriptional regulator [Evtepia sp.]|nr:MerR family transcriptional regulator [Evtepia sp.]